MRPQGPPPSPDEIGAWVKKYPGRHEGLKEATLFDAFNVGDEVGPDFVCSPTPAVGMTLAPNCQKLDFAVVKWVGYDVDVATKLQRQMV